jgi:tyrosine-protein phosphatase SIW14
MTRQFVLCLAAVLLAGVSSRSVAAPNQSGTDTQPAAVKTGIRAPAPVVRLPDGARSSEHLFGLPGLENVGRVTVEIYRGAQPVANGYETLKKMGVRTVINLRTSMSEKKLVEAAGMRSIELPLGTFNNGDRSKVDAVVAVMADPSIRPVFVHCRQGRDRTGIVVAAYRMKVEGWSLAAAEAEMDSFGFNDIWINLRHFLHRYAATVERDGRANGTVTALDAPKETQRKGKDKK